MAFKSDKDREAYASKLRAAGFGEDEINADIKSIESDQPAPAAVAPPPVAAPVEIAPIKPSSRMGGGGSPMTQPEISPPPMNPAPASSPIAQLKEVEQARKEQDMALTDQVWNSTLGKMAAGAAAAYAVPQAYKLVNKFFGAEPPGKPLDYLDRDLPELGNAEPIKDKLPAQAQMTEAEWRASLSPQEQQMLERSEAARAARTAPAVAPAPTPAPVAAAAPAPVAAAPEPVVQPAAASPKAPALVQPPAGAVAPPLVAEPVVAVPPAPAPAAPIAEPVVAPVEAAPVETAPKPTKVTKPEYFEGYKNLPGAERQVLGTFGVAKDSERAKTLVNALKSTLPEGAALEFPKTEAGVSKGGMPNPKDILEFTNKHLGTSMKLDEKGKFPADFRYSEENLSKMHASILKEYENAKTPAAKAAAEKGFATLRSLAGLAGFGALAYGSLEAYKHGKKTGDWTPAGELGINTVAGAINPALMLGTYMGGLNSNEEQELAKRRYNAMVGGGRGIAPPSTYQR